MLNSVLSKVGRSVPLYIPNIIDYVRAALFVLYLLFAFYAPIIAFTIYFISAILDGVDGPLARHLNQQSSFGTVLDFSLDRVSIAGVLLVMSHLYPRLWLFFCLLMLLDIASHFMQLYKTVLAGENSHKQTAEIKNWALRLYYGKRPILFWTCFFHDMWIGFFYLYHFFPSHVLLYLSFICLPGFLFKSYIHVLQIIDACSAILRHERSQQGGSTI